MIWPIAARQQSAVNRGMQGFDAPVEKFRHAGDSRHFGG